MLTGTLKRLISAFLSILLLLTLFPVSAFAATEIASGYCGGEGDGTNLWWTLDSEGVLTISGTGAMQRYLSSSDVPWDANGSAVKTVILGSGVTSITKSFEMCRNLTSIKADAENQNFSNGEYGVLYNKNKTELIVYPVGNMQTSFTIPSSVTSIGNDAFNNCSLLKSVTIPSSVTSIGNNAFWFCSNLTSIEIPSGVTSIGSGAFEYCRKLTSIKIPDGVKSIGNYTFAYCSKLTDVEIPSSVTSIGMKAFDSCSALTDVYYGGTEAQWENITIGSNNAPLLNAALHCEGSSSPMTTVASGYCGGDTMAGYDAASGCYKNLSWTLDSEGTLTISGTGEMKNNAIVSDTMGPDYIEQWIEPYSTEIKAVRISSGVTSIGDYTFLYCSNLTSVTIPDNVTSIGIGSFEYCSGLGSVTIPNGVTSIGAKAFYSCNSLKSVTIGSSVSNIGDSAFSSCNSLTSITVDVKNPTYSSDSDGVLFNKGKTALIIYPAGNSRTAYTIPSSVMSVGNSAFYGCRNLSNVTIPSSVTSIGDCAFCYCSDLKNITIPGGVTNIGDYAFQYCSSLTSAELDTGVVSIGDYAFFYCINLTDITVPNTVTHIGDRAFFYCINLASITIPSSVTTIGNYAFSDDYCLAKATFNGNAPAQFGSNVFAGCASGFIIHAPKNDATWTSASAYNAQAQTWNGYPILFDVEPQTNIIASGYCGGEGDGTNLTWTLDSEGMLTICGMGAMKNYRNSTSVPWINYCSQIKEVNISNRVTGIGDSAFHYCNRLTNITIPNSVVSIGKEAFSSCSDLTSVKIGNGVTSIGWGSFSYCNRLTSITIPNSVVSIDSWAFKGCTGLTSVTIPNSVTGIGFGAFAQCTGLLSVTIPDSVTSIGESAFVQCTNLTSVTIPNSVTSIEARTFSSCRHLTNITIPNGVQSIGTETFYNCASLTQITIPNSVTSIGDSAFGCCSSLTGIAIPNSVISIGNYAFEHCDNLKSLSLPSSVASIGKYAFGYCLSLKQVMISSSAMIIAYNAFQGCSNVTDVYYIGTKKQWNAIDVGNWDFGMENATIHFMTRISSSALTTTESVSGIVRKDDGCKLIWKMDYAINDLGEKVNCKLSITIGGKNTNDEIMLYTTENGGMMPWLTDEYGFDKGEIVFLSVSGTKMNPIRITTEIFMDYSNLSDVILNNVSGIDSMAFRNCINLSSIQFSGFNSKLTIGTNAFENDALLTSVTLPSNVTHIGERAFAGTGLGEIFVPQNTTTIADSSFSECKRTVIIRCMPDSFAHTYAESHGFATEIVSTVPDGKVRLFYNTDKYVDFSKTLDDFITCDSTVYNPELAYYLAVLANSAYIENNVVDNFTSLGMNGLVHPHYNEPDTSTVAYCIGKKVATDGTTVVLIDIRGTVGSMEWLSNITTGLDTELVAGKHLGFYNCAKEVHDSVKNLLDGSIKTTDVKYFVTGHSRGAAAANLLSDMFYQDGVSKYDVYDYNFACPDVARGLAWDWNPNGVHNNIFNIGNAADIVSVVPGIFGDTIGISPLITTWGKYGRSLWYSENWDSMSNTTLDITFAAHDMTKYMNEIKNVNEADFKDYMGWKLKATANAENARLKAFLSFCPVDVEIQDGNGNIVAAVRNGIVDYSDSVFGEVMILVSGDQKAILIDDSNKYRVLLTATDNGEMTYSVKDINAYSGKVSSQAEFNNVVLREGGKMVSFADYETPAEQSRLFVVNEKEEIVQEIQNNGQKNAVSAEALEIREGHITKESDKLLTNICIDNNSDIYVSGTIYIAYYVNGQMASCNSSTSISIPPKSKIIKNLSVDYSDRDNAAPEITAKVFLLNERFTPLCKAGVLSTE